MNEINFPELAVAARRLNLDAGDLIESVLSAMDAGHSERKALTMSIVEVLQRRGAYHGRLKQLVDDGTIFQITEDNNRSPAGPRRPFPAPWLQTENAGIEQYRGIRKSPLKC